MVYVFPFRVIYQVGGMQYSKIVNESSVELAQKKFEAENPTATVVDVRLYNSIG